MFVASCLLLVALVPPLQTVNKVFGETVGVKVLTQARGRGDVYAYSSVSGTHFAKGTLYECVEEYYAKDAKGKWRKILSTPTANDVFPVERGATPTSLRQSGNRLFAEPPTLAFQDVGSKREKDGSTVELIRSDSSGTIFKTIFVPAKGNVLKVSLTSTFAKQRESIEYFLDSLAFTPDGKPLSQGGKPDSTFSPGLRKGDNQVVGDHFFRNPVISAQKGTLAALMMPDVEVLKDNRPMPTILDLDAKNGVVDATLMSYGFADHRLAGHVWYVHDASMIKRVPKELKLAYRLIVDAQAEPFGAYRQAVKYTWDWYGRSYFDKVLPQAMPFEEYAKVCYPAAFSESYPTDRSDPANPAKQNKLGWFEHDIDGQVCGGIPAGWGFQQGWVSWQCWFNQLRSAWGLHWWGLKLKNQDWVDKSNKMLNLALAAPMDRGACPTTYQSREKQWKGSLIMPRADCYYDLTNMAWKGIWMLRWLEFPDCPRRDEILKQCREMAACMTRFQNVDGSFPTWLTKDMKVVPILDHSAQSALPCWFLAEMLPYAKNEGLSKKEGFGELAVAIAHDMPVAADFLLEHVVDQQLYYDFETFFSCSPKKCLQVNGVLDDPAMHDSHTLSPPQNTLCMQWTAEALFALAKSLDTRSGARFRSAALKALDIMALYQNAWNISYRKAAYTFGGFGVQNSDGEYNDARQAQFGCTLADFGAALGRRDYFERGVAATRASMTLINHPLHAENGIYPNPNYPLGLQPENTGHGGTDQQNGRTGFDWGEGSGLASMAWLLHQSDKSYMSYRTYTSQNWSRLIDGGYEGLKHVERPKVLQDPTFDFSDWSMPGWEVQGDFPEVPTWSDRMDFGVAKGEGFIGTCEDGRGGYDDRYTGTITSPPFTITKSKILLLVGGGSGEGVYVELVGPDGKRIHIERGHNAERMDERVWDVSALKGQTLRLRIVDKETGGWGHINLGRVRCGN